MPLKVLHQELDSLKMENDELRDRLARYESIHSI